MSKAQAQRRRRSPVSDFRTPRSETGKMSMSMPNTRNDGLVSVVTAITVFVILAIGAGVGAAIFALI